MSFVKQIFSPVFVDLFSIIMSLSGTHIFFAISENISASVFSHIHLVKFQRPPEKIIFEAKPCKYNSAHFSATLIS